MLRPRSMAVATAWKPFATLCGAGGACSSAASACHGACTPFHTGRWCLHANYSLELSNPHHQPRRPCTSEWCLNATNFHAGCATPQFLLTMRDGAVLPPLHATLEEKASVLRRCLRQLDLSSALRVLVVGDSQSAMLIPPLMRWAERGVSPPKATTHWCHSCTEGYTMSDTQATMLREAGWRWKYAWARVNAAYTKPTGPSRRELPLAVTLGRIKARLRDLHHGVSGGPSATHLLVVLGFGAWDQAYSAHADWVDVLAGGVRNTTDYLIGLLQGAAYKHVDLIVRNSFYSYSLGERRALRGQAAVDAIWEEAYRALMAARVPNTRVTFVNTSQLSSARYTEMPYMGDGIHWSCLSKQTSGAQRCLAELGGYKGVGMSGANATAGRPDEVAWAALAVGLHGVCEGVGGSAS